MIRMLTASTGEIDEADAAVAAIRNQLDLENNLGKNAVGIVTCHAEFIATGVLKAVCDSLPFEVIGTTTLGGGTDKAAGLEILTVSVLTSDEVAFSTVLTGPLAADDRREQIQTACDNAQSALPGAPSLVLAYAPLLQNVGGERLVKILDEILGGVPLFGTLTCDHNFDFRDSRVICNGEAYTDRLALIFLSGQVACRFFTVSVPEGKAGKQNAIITESEGNVVRKVNDLPLLQYLETIGLTAEAGLAGSKSIPVILDYNDGTPAVARCFYMISPEGNAVCGGDMPMGATFALSSMDPEDILISADQVLDRVLDSSKPDCMLIMPCIVRSVTLGMDQMAEAKRVLEKLGGSIPYQLCYSGGEICPVYRPNGGTANRFHNFSFAVCVFER